MKRWVLLSSIIVSWTFQSQTCGKYIKMDQYSGEASEETSTHCVESDDYLIKKFKDSKDFGQWKDRAPASVKNIKFEKTIMPYWNHPKSAPCLQGQFFSCRVVEDFKD